MVIYVISSILLTPDVNKLISIHSSFIFKLLTKEFSVLIGGAMIDDVGLNPYEH